MKKLLLSTAAVGLAFAATPAHAQIDIEIGGFFKGYAAYVDQDEEGGASAQDVRDFDILRSSELHFTGETTLDNGLTVGFHAEAEIDGPDESDGFEVEESYAYFAGGWGRVNFGAEDGAQYLLQVAAPSADSNVDGLRQDINAINFSGFGGGAALTELGTLVSVSDAGGIDYENNATNTDDKITYLSPIFGGFQLGASYTPDVDDGIDAATAALNGNNLDDVAGEAGEAYEIAGRYEGQFSGVGVIFGAGYTFIDLEEDLAAPAAGDVTDDREQWNVGLDLDIGPFGVGVVYTEDNNGERVSSSAAGATVDDEETFVVGVDYTTGPFKLGASYFTQDAAFGTDNASDEDGVDIERFTGGIVYTYGPGMTFRGSISYTEFDGNDTILAGTEDEVDATTILLGTQINF